MWIASFTRSVIICHYWGCSRSTGRWLVVSGWRASGWEGAKPAARGRHMPVAGKARSRCAWEAHASGWEGAKPLRMLGAWPRPPGHPRHPGRSGQREALSTRLSFASAKRSLLAGHSPARSAYPLADPAHPGCPGCLGGLGCPPSNGIPCGRPVHWQAALLTGGPSIGRRHSLRAKRSFEKAPRP